MSLKTLLISISKIGHLPDDSSEEKVKKSFLIYLGLFMSGGGILWGLISFTAGLYLQGFIPIAYTIITIFNLYFFHKSKNFNVVRFIQILISLILPFLFQWALGGYFSSGALMLWALLALVASPSFQTPRSSLIWLVLYILLTAISSIFQDAFFNLKPDILSDESLLFISLNAGIIGAIIFFLVIYFVQRSNSAQDEIQAVNDKIQKQKELVASQNETLHAAIEETNEIIVRAMESGNYDIRMNIDDKEGVWKEMAVSINKLFDKIALPMNTVMNISHKMADGDLASRFEEEATGQILMLKNSLNDSLDQFSGILLQIRSQSDDIGNSLETMQQSAEVMADGTNEINTAVGEISKGATNQLVKVDEVSNLLSMVSESAKGIDKQALSINKKALEGVQKSQEAIRNVEDLSKLVDDNFDHSTLLMENCKSLDREAKSISEFTRLINEIASQTNLLSLNAGILAADAGESGKGFGVVAEEIRMLADKARGSVVEIDEVVSTIQNRVDEIQQKVAIMNGAIKKNKDFSLQINKDFTALVDDMNGVVSQSKTISEATSHQNKDLSEIVRLTETIVAIAEETASSSKLAADSTSGLSIGMQDYRNRNQNMVAIAKELKEKTTRFVLKEN